jgi:DEAD/DEAH box helicase domain-containing protein
LEHVERLVAQPFEVIEKDGSPHGAKGFVLWNPPLIDEARKTRRSSNTEAAFLFSELVRHGVRTLTFARTRRLTELIYNYTRQQLNEPELAKRIRPYRAGYLAEDRRQIEQELFHGYLIGVVATTALELGVDIGDLDATVLSGYPGSIASTWQQAGRSGRRTGKSLSFLIGFDNPLDQYFMRYPEYLFHRGFESALTNPNNKYVLKSHILCAAWERPITEDEKSLWGEDFTEAVQELEDEHMLRARGLKWYLAPSINYPAEAVNIRSTSSVCYTIVDISQGNRQLETVEYSLALFQIHPGAVYLHYGESYLVNDLDLSNHIAYVEPTDVPYYTQAKDITDIQIKNTLVQKETNKVMVYLGKVEVNTTVVGYRKKMQMTEEVIGEEPLDLPPQIFDTVALWFDMPDEALNKIINARLDYAGGLHATEHASIAMLPLFALCDRNDLGGVSTVFHADTGKAQVFIYDAHPGGTGIAEKGFEIIDSLWNETLKMIVECPCEDGCPGCVQSPKCGNNNHPLDKEAAKVILQELVRTS